MPEVLTCIGNCFPASRGSRSWRSRPWLTTLWPARPSLRAGRRLEVLSLAEAERQALANNPTILGARAARSVAAGELTTARTYPFNPQFEAGYPGLLAGGATGLFEVRVGQELEWAGQGRLRSTAFQAHLEAEGEGVTDATRTLLRDVRIAYLGLVAAEARLGVADQVRMETERLLGASTVQLAEGEISRLDANFASIAATRADGGRLRADADRESAALALLQVMGLPLDQDITVVGPEDPSLGRRPDAELDGPTMVRAAMARRPDLLASEREVEASAALAELARRERLPNLRISAGVERDEPRTDPRWGFAVGFSVPLFDRGRGGIQQRAAETASARVAQEAVALTIRTEVLDALQEYEAASRALDRMDAGLLTPLRENQGLLQEAYTEGKVELTTLVLLQNELLQAELDYWDAWEWERTALVRLQAATGAVLDTVPDTGPAAEGIR